MGMTILIIVLVLVVLAVVAAGLVEFDRRRLRAAFGSEYDRAAREHGGQWQARRELMRRRRAHRDLNLRRLSAQERQEYTEAWQRVQLGFIDDPRGAVAAADTLVADLIAARGYPASDEKERMALLSVEHGSALNGYRAARGTHLSADADDGPVSTDDMREAMVRYRVLYQQLLSARSAETVRQAMEPRRAEPESETKPSEPDRKAIDAEATS